MEKKEWLNLGEVAAFLGWTPRIVERLAQGGKIPGMEISGQWRFRREELVDWLDQKIQTLDAARLKELEHTLEAELSHAGATPASISEQVGETGILLDSDADRKSAVLKELIEVAERTGHVLDGAHIHASLVERESLCSTAFPGGVAICHPRRPTPYALRAPILVLLRTRRPIPFGADDGEPTQLFFLLCALDDRSHLHGLARLVRLLNRETLEKLRVAASPKEAHAILKTRESRVNPAVSDQSDPDQKAL